MTGVLYIPGLQMNRSSLYVMVCSGAANVLAGAGPVRSSQTVCFCSPGSTQPVPLCPRLRPLAVTWPLWHQSLSWIVDSDDTFNLMPKKDNQQSCCCWFNFMNAYYLCCFYQRSEIDDTAVCEKWTGVIWDMFYVVGACKWLPLVSGALSIFNHKWSFQFYYVCCNIKVFVHVHFWAVGIVRVNSLNCRKMEDSEGRAERAKRLNLVFSLWRYAFSTTGAPLCDPEELHCSELKW